jgi:molecular chaperone Hsp33
MAQSKPINPAQAGLEIRTHYVRARNVLLARAVFSELCVDWFLHVGEYQLKVAAAHAELFKRALAAFALHCAARPWRELHAWTLHFEAPKVNLFLTADNETGALTGRVFAEDVRALSGNVLYADVVRLGRGEKRRSVVEFTGDDSLAAVEAYYAQSEQRPARLFQLGEEEYALVVEHPDCERAWFEQLSADEVRSWREDSAELGLLEKREYRWHCGCNQERMCEVLAPSLRAEGADGLFGESEEALTIECPRCGAKHRVTREALEAFVACEGGEDGAKGGLA